jgi:5-methylcytosine-specific restriction endonuclease McrA
MAWDQKRRPPSEYIHPKKAARILAAHQGVCWLCGHDGATEVDHVVPWAEWTRTDLSVHDASNLAPAHGEPCATCGRNCHLEKSLEEAARGTKRRAAKAKRPPERHPGAI